MTTAAEPGFAEDGETIDATNFRFCAQRAIQRYIAEGMLLDAMFWSTIVRHYEALLTQGKNPIEGETP